MKGGIDTPKKMATPIRRRISRRFPILLANLLNPDNSFKPPGY